MQRKQRPLGRPRQDKNIKPTKKTIVDVATRLFLSLGYQSVSMEDVAESCDVTKATVYYYYAKKSDLFTDAMVGMMDRITKRIYKILTSKNTLYERLIELATTHLTATFDLDLNLFMKEAKITLSKEQLLKMKEAEEQMYLVLEESLKKAMEQEEIPERHPRLAAHAFITILSIGNYRDSGQEPIFSSIDEAAKKIVDFYWHGLDGGSNQ